MKKLVFLVLLFPALCFGQIKEQKISVAGKTIPCKILGASKTPILINVESNTFFVRQDAEKWFFDDVKNNGVKYHRTQLFFYFNGATYFFVSNNEKHELLLKAPVNGEKTYEMKLIE